VVLGQRTVARLPSRTPSLSSSRKRCSGQFHGLVHEVLCPTDGETQSFASCPDKASSSDPRPIHHCLSECLLPPISGFVGLVFFPNKQFHVVYAKNENQELKVSNFALNESIRVVNAILH